MHLLALWFWFFQAAADPQALGIKALDEQKYEQALTHFDTALKADPTDVAARFYRALALGLLNRDAEAAGEYRKVLEKQPGLYEAELNLGLLELRQKRLESARELLGKARAQKPKEFRPNYFLGEALLESKDWEGAEPILRAALDADPKSAAAMAGLGRALARQGRVKESAPYFAGAAEADPAFKPALLELGELHEKAGNRAEAIAIYQQFPNEPGAAERLGVLQMAEGKAAEAVASLEEAVKQAPTTANRLALATAYLRAKQNDKAAPLIAAATAEEPNNPELHLTLGRIHREAKRLPDAAREFLRAAQIDPNLKPAWSELASTLFLLGDYTQTLKAFARLKALGEENNAGVLYLEALCYDRMRMYKEALPAYEKFLAAAAGKMPEEEFKGRQRLRIVKKEVDRR